MPTGTHTGTQDRVGPQHKSTRFMVVAGLAMPFFPARPAHGVVLSKPAQAVGQFSKDLDGGFVIQPKRNGDRAGLAIVRVDGIKRVLVQNRFGGWTTFAVTNAQRFASLAPGSCFDGEIINKTFYPFECLALEGVNFVSSTTTERATYAKRVCEDHGVEWIFATPTKATIRKLRQNLPHLEGYVRKSEAPYQIGYSESAETTRWFKMKW